MCSEMENSRKERYSHFTRQTDHTLGHTHLSNGLSLGWRLWFPKYPSDFWRPIRWKRTPGESSLLSRWREYTIHQTNHPSDSLFSPFLLASSMCTHSYLLTGLLAERSSFVEQLQVCFDPFTYKVFIQKSFWEKRMRKRVEKKNWRFYHTQKKVKGKRSATLSALHLPLWRERNVTNFLTFDNISHRCVSFDSTQHRYHPERRESVRVWLARKSASKWVEITWRITWVTGEGSRKREWTVATVDWNLAEDEDEEEEREEAESVSPSEH